MSLPAAAIRRSINKLRCVTLIDIKRAKNTRVRNLTLADIQDKLGTPAEIAKKLVDRLRNEARVI
ncbi:MAG: hypothetical protein ABI076_06280 [Acidobacteriaceae bacterium]